MSAEGYLSRADWVRLSRQKEKLNFIPTCLPPPIKNASDPGNRLFLSAEPCRSLAGIPVNAPIR